MTERALVFWDDDTFYIIALKSITEEPKKPVDEYRIGDKIRSKIRGFPGVFSGEIITISNDIKFLLKEKLRMEREGPGEKVQKPMAKPKRQRLQENKENRQEKSNAAQQKRTEQLKMNNAVIASLDMFQERTMNLTLPPQQPVMTSTPIAVDMYTSRTDNTVQQNEYHRKDPDPQAFRQELFNMPREQLPQIQMPKPRRCEPQMMQSMNEQPAPLPQYPPQPMYQNRPIYLDQPVYHNQTPPTELSSVLSGVRHTLHDVPDDHTYTVGTNNRASPCADCERLEGRLAAAEHQLQVAREELETAQKELSRFVEPVEQQDLPKPGRIAPALAEKHHMVELLPSSGVFVRPKDIKACQHKTSGTGIARHLMSVFWTNEELVSAGNLSGSNGKLGLDPVIVETIQTYTVMTKATASLQEVKISMRTKISALVSKWNQVHKMD